VTRHVKPGVASLKIVPLGAASQRLLDRSLVAQPLCDATIYPPVP